MWKPDTNNPTLPPMEGYHKEIQYPEQYKNTTRNGL